MAGRHRLATVRGQRRSDRARTDEQTEFPPESDESEKEPGAAEEEIPEEVEAALDEILRERLETGLEEEEEKPEETENAEVLAIQPDEFVCQQCFLIKNRSQLADPVTETCRDCANS